MPYGIRTWQNGQMFYPALFTVQLNIEKYTAHMITRVENEVLQIDEYMLLTPFTAVNGPIYESDIVTNGKVVGEVDFDDNQGAYVAKFKGGSVLLNTMGRTKILGNRYDNLELLDLISDRPKYYLQQPEDEAKDTIKAISNIMLDCLPDFDKLLQIIY